MNCNTCGKPIDTSNTVSDEGGDYCQACYEKWMHQSAIDAGIPLSVIEGKTNLTDHFSQAYIDFKRNRQGGQ